MPEKDIVRIALVVLLLGFSLPEIARLMIGNRTNKETIVQTDPPLPPVED